MALGVIGGSGIYNLDSIEKIESYNIETPFGKPSSDIEKARLNGVDFYFLSRHGDGHTLNPSEINYRANIFALKKLGVRNIISISAVGSLKEEIKPGDIVLPTQFIDWTKGIRKRTFFENGVVGHVSVSEPIEQELVQRIYGYKSEIDATFHFGGAYICIEGPQFSSKAESSLFRSFGASVIGMTNVPESYLAKEAGIAYSTIALVTDYDCWREQSCSVDEILKTLNENIGHAKKLLKLVIPDLCKRPIEFKRANENIVVTNESKISAEAKEKLKIILS